VVLELAVTKYLNENERRTVSTIVNSRGTYLVTGFDGIMAPQRNGTSFPQQFPIGSHSKISANDYPLMVLALSPFLIC